MPWRLRPASSKIETPALGGERRSMGPTKKLTILAATAHPDDVEVFCAGTLIRYVKEGHKVFMAIACTGNVGSKIHTGPEIEAIRAVEAQARRRSDRGGVDPLGSQRRRIMAGSRHLDPICGPCPAHQSGCDHHPRPGRLRPRPLQCGRAGVPRGYLGQRKQYP